MKKWTVSVDEEIWNNNEFFESKEEAIKYGKERYEEMIEETGWDQEGIYQAVIFVGQVEVFTPSVQVDDIIEVAQEQAYDHGGEYAEGYLNDVSGAAIRDLENLMNNTLLEWIEKHKVKTNFYQIVNVEEINFPLPKVEKI